MLLGSVGRDHLMMTLKRKDIRYDLGSWIFLYEMKSVNLEIVSFKSQEHDFLNLA
jgi:hypothetical protein